MNNKKFSFSAKKTLSIEIESIKKISSIKDEVINDFIGHLASIKGRIIWSGVGKSGLIAQKIVATMNSTGTPALFLHATEAMHGDLGMLQNEDCIILISNSGNTSEVVKLAEILKSKNIPFLAIVGSESNYIYKNAIYNIKYDILQEACHNGLAPTTSTTVQLILGDMIAIALSESKEFTPNDFKNYHPDGILGEKLNLKVKDIMTSYKPKVDNNDSLEKIILTISENRLGATAVFESNNLCGIITDGDLRRMLLDNKEKKKIAKEIMNPNPKIISPEHSALDCLIYMKKEKISQLIIMNSNNVYLGIIHIHDIINKGF